MQNLTPEVISHSEVPAFRTKNGAQSCIRSHSESPPLPVPPKSTMPSPSSFWLFAPIRLRAGCMTIRINIYCTSLDYSEPLEKARLKQEQRNAPGAALASRFGFHRRFIAMTARLRRLLLEALLVGNQPTSAPSSRRTHTT